MKSHPANLWNAKAKSCVIDRKKWNKVTHSFIVLIIFTFSDYFAGELSNKIMLKETMNQKRGASFSDGDGYKSLFNNVLFLASRD